MVALFFSKSSSTPFVFALPFETIFLLTGMGNDYLNEVQSTCDVDLVSNNLLEAAKGIKSILQ